MITTVKFAKIRPTAEIPTKRIENAGYDIYADFEEDYIIVPPHKTKMIPTGIASACDTDYCFILKERGSTGSKGIAQICGVIDSGYRNEWFIPITNTTDKTLYIAKNTSNINVNNKDSFVYPYGKAIAQAIIIPVPQVDIEEYTYDELKAIPSQRGNGALGSSGK